MFNVYCTFLLSHCTVEFEKCLMLLADIKFILKIHKPYNLFFCVFVAHMYNFYICDNPKYIRKNCICDEFCFLRVILIKLSG